MPVHSHHRLYRGRSAGGGVGSGAGSLAIYEVARSNGPPSTTLGNIVPYTNNGVTKDVTVLRPENQGDGHVRGAELAWNGFFDFLPGWGKYFGARAAYTYVDSGGTRNAAANLNLPAFADDYGQLDASLQWKFKENMSFGLEAVNLTREKFKILVDNDVVGSPGNGAGLTYHNWVDSDRRVTVYVRASF